MKCSHGDIWEFYDRGFYAVIPVNVGWKTDPLGRTQNVMGRGLAFQAKGRFPECAGWLGTEYLLTNSKSRKDMGDVAWLRIYPGGRLIFFPTKPLDKAAPWRSWKVKSDIVMIGKHLDQLPKLITDAKIDRVAIPLVGAGYGMLDPIVIKDLIFSKLGSDRRFTLVLPHNPKEQPIYGNFISKDEEDS